MHRMPFLLLVRCSNARSLAPAQLWRDTGVRGLFRGVTPSVLRAFLVSGSRFTAFETVLELLR